MLAAFFLVGCGSASVDILHMKVDAGLDIKQLERERIAVLPAMASSPLMDATELAPLRAQLASELARSRPSIGVVEPARVDRALLDHPELGVVLQGFARTLTISREDLRALSAATGARFLVFTVFDEYSFGWGERTVPEYKASKVGDGKVEGVFADAVAGAVRDRPGVVSAVVGLGIMAVVSAAASPSPDSSVTLTGKASARLTGTLSIFNAAEGRPVWVGAAMVNESVEESASVAAKGARLGDVPAPTPPEPAKLTPRFFQALVSRWPS